MNQPLLEVRGVSKAFGKVQANKDLSIHVNPGEIVALLGENGAGKSTTIGMMLANIPAVIVGERLAQKLPLKAIRIAAAILFIATIVLPRDHRETLRVRRSWE